jgi:glycosyltransferase involved in cell wall biosynthesis
VAPNAPSQVFSHCTGDDCDGDSVLARFELTARSYLLVVGNLDPRKNLVRLAAAYGLLTAEQRSETPLVVVGGNADIFRNSPIHWPSGTVVTGYVDDTSLGHLYANSMAFVFPSLAEGFGLPIVEAVAAGASRLLVSDIPVFRWICGASAAFVDPTSIDDLAAALKPDRIVQIPRSDPAMTARFDWSQSAAALYDAARLVAKRHVTQSSCSDGRSRSARFIDLRIGAGMQQLGAWVVRTLNRMVGRRRL